MSDTVALIHGDCLEELKNLPDNCVDSLLTDPPAGISFMGRSWDSYTVDLPDPAFINWFAGFVDGEGCFSVHRKPHDTFDCQFAIGLRADDRPILLEIQRTLKIGTITDRPGTDNKNAQARFCVSSKRDCLRLAEILRAAPLRAKKAADFEIWLEALRYWIDHKPGDWADMKDARERLMTGRHFKEYGVVAGSPERRAFICEMKAVFKEAMRVMKPGAHGLVWSLPRTSHWTATALENAGFEIRDCVYHLFGQGFPKSMDVIKAAAKTPAPLDPKWQGFGTALKPAAECWWLIRKPLSEKTVAANVQKWGTGALNIDGCRIGSGGHHGGKTSAGKSYTYFYQKDYEPGPNKIYNQGRFPSHLILDEQAAEMLDEQSGVLKSGAWNGKRNCPKTKNTLGKFELSSESPKQKSEGGASRFFYVAKVSTKERGEGNSHPTVKSIKLMTYLARLITPPGGIILDPFMGSGSTGLAAKAEGFEFIGIEREAEYFAIAEKRIAAGTGK